MAAGKIFEQLNVPGQCRRYGLPLWQCPQFLFLVMGLIIIGANIFTYIIGTRFVDDPAIVALIVIILTVVLFIIAFVITQGFERLAEANRMKTEFISIVSHQLRSPLSNLKWATELLMSGRLGKVEEKQTEYYRILKENSARMQELISDLLAVSRIETATLSLKKQEMSLTELTEEVIKSFEIFVRFSNVKLSFDFQENLPRIFADPSQIRLVIENLLDNAARYIRKDGEVSIKIGKRSRGIFFEIKDTGVGIPKKDQKHIFQKFFRAENATRYQTQGSGLGLYIAKAVIEKSGGKIGFKSQEGVGSTFWFTLPIFMR